MPVTIDQALCIRTWDWSETSQTALLFSREHGMVRALAKGSRRPRSPFSGGLEPLTRGEMIAIIKPHLELASLTGWDLQEMFPAIRRQLGAFYAGMYMAQLVEQGVTDHDPHPGLFDHLLSAFRGLEQRQRWESVILAFQWELLSEIGYRPELHRDVERRENLATSSTYVFIPRLGGFGHDAPGSAELADRWRVRADTLAVLRMVAGGEAARASESMSSIALDRALRLLAQYLTSVLGREFTSFDQLKAQIRNTIA